MKNRTASGFTLVELMVTIVVLAVVAGLTVPNLIEFSKNNRLSGISTDLVRAYQQARSEAIKIKNNVVVCMSSNPTASDPTCVTSGHTGWVTFIDTNNDWDHTTGEEVLRSEEFDSSAVKILGNQSLRISFASTGFLNPSNSGSTMSPTTAIAICDSRGNKAVSSSGQSTARGIELASGSGRPSTTRDKTKIGNFSITGLGTLCPG